MQGVLRLRWIKAAVFLIGILALAQTSLATTFVVQTDEEMIVKARGIVKGKVVAVTSAFDEEHKSIYTYITLKVDQVLKGEITSRKIVLREAGGQVGDQGSIVFGVPTFTVGEHVVVYLGTWADGTLRVHQMMLGKFSILTDPGTGQEIVSRSGADSGNITILSSDQSKGTVTDSMELESYLQLVREKLTANIVQAQEFEARYYSDIPLLRQPAEYHRASSKGTIEPQYHLWSPPIRWFEPDTGQSVVFRTNPASAPNPQIGADMVAAMNAWSTVPGCSLRVTDGGSTGGCGLFSLDGQNTISFNNCDGYFSAGSEGILAVASIANYTTSVTRVIGGVTFFKALEGNISFNPFSAAYFGDHCNVQEITTHEMGHSLGLHHSWQSGFPGTPTASDQAATMYWVAHFDGRCASLRPDDVNGITFIYPGTGGGGGPLSISTTSPLSSGSVGSAYSQSLAATGGTIPYTWTVVTVAGQSLPPGLTLGSSGVLGGTPTTAGTYNFTAQVRDSTATPLTAQRVFAITVSSQPAQPFNSTFVSQTTPAWVAPGQTFSVTLRFNNTGTQTWTGSPFLLVSQNPELNFTWLGGTFNAITLASANVPAGQQLVVTFNFTAPSTPGAYNFQWQLYQNGGVGFFGQASNNVAVQVTRFSDVPTTHAYYTQIERIAQLGITLGCATTSYCPNDPVTREQMAVFMERALGVPNPPPATGQTFIDVAPDRWSYAFIEDFAHRGITLGCATGVFCPLTPIPRDQMVTLLERAVGRPNPPTPPTQRFVDVLPSRWSYGFVDSYVKNGLSLGVLDVVKRDCNSDGLHFCPDRVVTRAEMAPLIVIGFRL